MNENYLWDKTGSDSEIEKLENTLQAFRYAETAAPALPAKVFTSKTDTSRRSFLRFGLAFAACIGLVLLGAGVWNLLSKSNREFENDSAKIAAPQNSALHIQPPVIESPTDSAVQKTPVLSGKIIELTRQTPKQKITKAHENSPPVNLKNETNARKNAPLESNVKLTGEEKYAYNQLMLALSITSAKLKIVKDKIDNSETPNVVFSSKQ